MNDNEQNYYTYLDECKRNYLTDVMKNHTDKDFEEYSITSITFEKDYYQQTLEHKWKEFRNKYNISGEKAMHFVDFKKLIDSDRRDLNNSEYSTFVKDGVFSEVLLKHFFNDLKDILKDAEFFIVHNDCFWEKKRYLAKRKKYEILTFTKQKRNIASSLLNEMPYLAMRKQLDLLMKCLLQKKIENHDTVEDGYYFDEELPKKINTKLRFDADGKQFDARSDLKKAYVHTIAMGSDTVNADTTVEILDEIRFIRKEEVGHDYMPSHCGLEIVDLLCSMIAGETRAKKYIEEKIIEPHSDFEKGSFINLKFSDGEEIKFDFILDKKMRSSSTIQLFY